MLLMIRSGDGDGPSVWYWVSIRLVITIPAMTMLWTIGSLRPRRGDIDFPNSHHSVTAEVVSKPTSTAHNMRGYYWFLVAMAMIVGGAYVDADIRPVLHPRQGRAR